MRQYTVATPYLVGETHFYTAELAGELVLFDTGPATRQGEDFLRRSVDLARLKHVFVTHCHVDHYGLSDFLARHTRAEIYLPRMDAVKIRRHAERIEAIERLMREAGCSERFVSAVRATVNANGVFPTFPERFRVVEEDTAPQRLGISWLACPGHSQSDLIYRIGDDAVTGDTLLRDIFQAPLLDIDLATFAGRFRNYDAYCTSLLQLQQLQGCRLLPGHRQSTAGLQETILAYISKLLERAARIRNFGDLTPYELLAQLFGAPPTENFISYIKLSEIIFLRDFLATPHRLEEVLVQIGLFEAVRERYYVAVDPICPLPGDLR